MRLDESQWITVHDRIHRKSDPWERIPVHPTQPTDRAIIAINRLSTPPHWHRAGIVTQEWLRLSIPVTVAFRKIGWNELTLMRLEPVEISVLWVQAYEWVPDFNLRVEIREWNGDG
jgi:hypothetical protein